MKVWVVIGAPHAARALATSFQRHQCMCRRFRLFHESGISSMFVLYLPANKPSSNWGTPIPEPPWQLVRSAKSSRGPRRLQLGMAMDALGLSNIDVEDPWFPHKNSLQMVDFPHLGLVTLYLLIVWNSCREAPFWTGKSSCLSMFIVYTCVCAH